MNIRFLLLASALALGACTPKMVDKLPYYKLKVVQGMPFDAQRVLALQTGMTRTQVQMEIGTPLLNPFFRQNRWDYLYKIVRGGQVQENRYLTVHFHGDTVSRIEGTALDYAREQVAQTSQELAR